MVGQYVVFSASGGGAGGTVTSVSMTVPSLLAVAGSPITTSGTLAVTYSGTALPVLNGGTGNTTFTPYSVLCAGTTSTGLFQNVSGVGTSGQVLTSNGASALPTWQAAAVSGTVTSVAMSVPSFLSISGSPITTSGTLALTLSGTALPVANGGTGVTSVTTAPAATKFAGWDGAKNLSANNFLAGYTTQDTSAGAPSLTVSSSRIQRFSGSTDCTPAMPQTSTLALGTQFVVLNDSAVNIFEVLTYTGVPLVTMNANTSATFTCISTSVDTAAAWDINYNAGTLGTVTTVSVASANGFAGSVANATSTPAITISTSITGLLKGNGTAVSAATAGTDYWGNASNNTTSGTIGCTNTTQATSASTGAYTCSGGMSAAKNIVAGGQSGSVAYSAGNSSTAITIDFNNSAVQTVTMTGNCTFTLSNGIAGFSYLLILTQDNTGTRTLVGTSPSVKWKGGTQPTLTTTATTGIDILSLTYDGTNWYGSAGLAFA